MAYTPATDLSIKTLATTVAASDAQLDVLAGDLGSGYVGNPTDSLLGPNVKNTNNSNTNENSKADGLAEFLWVLDKVSAGALSGKVPSIALLMPTAPVATKHFTIAGLKFEFLAAAGTVSQDANIGVVIGDAATSALNLMHAINGNVPNVTGLKKADTSAAIRANTTVNARATILPGVATTIYIQSADAPGGNPIPNGTTMAVSTDVGAATFQDSVTNILDGTPVNAKQLAGVVATGAANFRKMAVTLATGAGAGGTFTYTGQLQDGSGTSKAEQVYVKAIILDDYATSADQIKATYTASVGTATSGSISYMQTSAAGVITGTIAGATAASTVVMITTVVGVPSYTMFSNSVACRP